MSVRRPAPAPVLRRAARRAAKDLCALSNVSHVTVGEKEVAGDPVGRLAVKVYVVRKDDVPPEARVPPRIELRGADGRVIGSVETDVVETGGEPDVFGLRSGHRLLGFDREAGTAGLTFTKDGADYALTNAHVVCDVAHGMRHGPVSWLSAGAGPVHLGPVVRATPLRPGVSTDEDVAVIRIDSGAPIDAAWVDVTNAEITQMDVIRWTDQDVWYVAKGRRFACTAPEPVESGRLVRVDGVVIRYTGFWQFRVVDGASAHGHSGALVVRSSESEEHVACGLVFGGVAPGYVWAFPFLPLYDRIYRDL